MSSPGMARLVAEASMTLLDAARAPGVVEELGRDGVEPRSLYQGPSETELADVAPYLVPVGVGPESPVPGRVEKDLWGRSAVVLLTTEADLEDVRAHCRRLLMVLTEDGKCLYFRFYDPRVLRVFLPTCDSEQLAKVFGPITAFTMEAEEPGLAMRFSLGAEGLKTDLIDLAADPARKAPLKIDWKGRR